MYLGSSRSVYRPFPAGPESWAMDMGLESTYTCPPSLFNHSKSTI
jgi:hypothetical protein